MVGCRIYQWMFNLVYKAWCLNVSFPYRICHRWSGKRIDYIGSSSVWSLKECDSLKMTKGSKAVGRNLLPSLPLEDTEFLPKGTDDIIFKLLPAVLSIWIVT